MNCSEEQCDSLDATRRDAMLVNRPSAALLCSVVSSEAAAAATPATGGQLLLRDNALHSLHRAVGVRRGAARHFKEQHQTAAAA